MGGGGEENKMEGWIFVSMYKSIVSTAPPPIKEGGEEFFFIKLGDEFVGGVDLKKGDNGFSSSFKRKPFTVLMSIFG